DLSDQRQHLGEPDRQDHRGHDHYRQRVGDRERLPGGRARRAAAGGHLLVGRQHAVQGSGRRDGVASAGHRGAGAAVQLFRHRGHRDLDFEPPGQSRQHSAGGDHHDGAIDGAESLQRPKLHGDDLRSAEESPVTTTGRPLNRRLTEGSQTMTRLQPRHLLRAEHGYALVLSLVILLGFSVLGLTLLTLGTTEVASSASWKDYSKAFYAADGGLESGVVGLRELLANTPAPTAAQLAAIAAPTISTPGL